MKEIERKFLVDHQIWEKVQKPEPIPITQAYLSRENECVVRVRTKGERAFITIKGKTIGITRSEYEFEINFDEAKNLIDEFCKQVIVKKRYEIQHEDHLWEVDVFEGKHKNLILAEIELSTENECFKTPEWVLNEVSDDPKYFNSNLI